MSFRVITRNPFKSNLLRLKLEEKLNLGIIIFKSASERDFSLHFVSFEMTDGGASFEMIGGGGASFEMTGGGAWNDNNEIIIRVSDLIKLNFFLYQWCFLGFLLYFFENGLGNGLMMRKMS